MLLIFFDVVVVAVVLIVAVVVCIIYSNAVDFDDQVCVFFVYSFKKLIEKFVISKIV